MKEVSEIIRLEAHFVRDGIAIIDLGSLGAWVRVGVGGSSLVWSAMLTRPVQKLSVGI